MSILEWSSRFELGVEPFDDHHKHLIGLLNKLFDDMTSGKRHESLEAILDELIDYATYHFAAEEYWMGVQNYPGLAHHREEHNRFSFRVVEIQKDFHCGKPALSLELLQFLNNWLTNHILKIDAEYGRFAAGLPRGNH